VPLDLTFVLWVGSLLLSAGLVAVFLWLMREPRDGKEGPLAKEGPVSPPAASESDSARVPSPESRVPPYE